MPRRQASKNASGGTRKRSRKPEDADDTAAGFSFLDDDAAKQQESEEEQEEQETAEQKRVRLARAYLDDLRAATVGGDDGGDELGDDNEEAAAAAARGDHQLAERLRLDALEAQGRLQRHIAHRLVLPQQQAPEASTSGRAALYGAGRFAKAHRLSPTALTLSSDEATAFTVSKDGSILKWDLETMTRTQILRPGSKAAKAAAKAAAASASAADWVKKGPRQNPTSSLLAAALSSDGKFLAVGGGDRLVAVFDAASGRHISSYPGHRDQVSSLAFRDGTHTLYSGGYDRTVKIWSLDDAAYVDTLFGHQGEVFALDAPRTERVVSVGHDHTCRLWKIPEESHLVFRSPSSAQHTVACLSGSEWLSGGCDGSLQVWNTLKKKPVSVTHDAHSGRHSWSSGGGSVRSAAAAAEREQGQQEVQPPPEKGSWATANSDTSCWVQSVAACKGSDLVASGAGDGFIRLWSIEPSKHGGAGQLKPAGQLPAVGFVNSLALGKSGRLCVAALGQEPRLGRWGRVGNARNGLLVHRWQLDGE